MTNPSNYKSESGNAGNGIIIIVLFSMESKIKVSAFKIKGSLVSQKYKKPRHSSLKQTVSIFTLSINGRSRGN